MRKSRKRLGLKVPSNRGAAAMLALLLATPSALNAAPASSSEATPISEKNWAKQSFGEFWPTTDHCDPIERQLLGGADNSASDEITKQIITCAQALGKNIPARRHRRGFYSGVAGVGGLGTALSGAQGMITTTNIWAGVAVLPVIFDTTFDSGDYVTLDGMTVRSLAWILNRGHDLKNGASSLGAHVAEINALTGKIGDPISGIVKQDASQCAYTPSLSLNNALVPNVKGNNKGDEEVDPHTTIVAYAHKVLILAATTQRNLCRQKQTVDSALPVWMATRYNYVVDVYETNKGDIAQGPEGTLRTFASKPFQILANFVRGDGAMPERFIAATNRARLSLAGVGEPLQGLISPDSAALPTAPEMNEKLSPSDMTLLFLAQQLADSIKAANATMIQLANLNAEQPKDFTLPTPESAPALPQKPEAEGAPR